MAISKPKAKPSGAANGVHSDYGSKAPKPDDFDSLRKEGWIFEFIWRAWPVLVVLGGGIFAAGGLWVKIDTTKEWHLEERAAILAQGKTIEDIKNSFADFRIEWAAEQAKIRRAIEDIAPVADERQKIFPAPKKRAIHKPSGLFN